MSSASHRPLLPRLARTGRRLQSGFLRMSAAPTIGQSDPQHVATRRLRMGTARSPRSRTGRTRRAERGCRARSTRIVFVRWRPGVRRTGPSPRRFRRWTRRPHLGRRPDWGRAKRECLAQDLRQVDVGPGLGRESPHRSGVGADGGRRVARHRRRAGHGRNSPQAAVDSRFDPITAGRHERAPDLRFRRSSL